jgi:hypothetical protein
MDRMEPGRLHACHHGHAMAHPRPPAWRLSLVWRDTVLDTVSVTEKRCRIDLRTGDHIDVEVGDHSLRVSGDRLEATLLPGQRLHLPAGHELLAEIDTAPAPAVLGDLGIDSTLLHSGMIAVAMTVCAVSALWLHPGAGPHDPGGGGLHNDSHRWLSLSGGSAHVVGRPTFQAHGRPVALAERFEVRATPGAAPQKPPSATLTLEAALTSMSEALQRGGGGNTPRRDALGEAVSHVSAAPVLGAGVGGLSPKDPIDSGVGAGLIGAGDNQRVRAIRRQQARDDDRALPDKRTYPISTIDVPDAAVADDGAIMALPELDPMVREHLTRMIRGRHNVVRGCYESWGLNADARAVHLGTGRLVLELTLRPDGRVQQLTTTVSDPGLARVGRCIERAAAEWYLGDGLVDEPTRLAFPFNLQPRH